MKLRLAFLMLTFALLLSACADTLPSQEPSDGQTDAPFYKEDTASREFREEFLALCYQLDEGDGFTLRVYDPSNGRTDTYDIRGELLAEKESHLQPQVHSITGWLFFDGAYWELADASDWPQVPTALRFTYENGDAVIEADENGDMVRLTQGGVTRYARSNTTKFDRLLDLACEAIDHQMDYRHADSALTEHADVAAQLHAQKLAVLCNLPRWYPYERPTDVVDAGAEVLCAYFGEGSENFYYVGSVYLQFEELPDWRHRLVDDWLEEPSGEGEYGTYYLYHYPESVSRDENGDWAIRLYGSDDDGVCLPEGEAFDLSCEQLANAWFMTEGTIHKYALPEAFARRSDDELRALFAALSPAERAALGAGLRRVWGSETFNERLSIASEALTADEVGGAQDFCDSGVVRQSFLMNLFDDVRSIDLGDLMRYAPNRYQDEIDNDAEWQAFHAAVVGTDWEDSGDMPLCRYTRENVDALLAACTDITAADLRHSRYAFYLEEYDAWYDYVSDMDWGTFRIGEGERWGDVLFLRGDSMDGGENLLDRALTLLQTDDGYQIIAFTEIE